MIIFVGTVFVLPFFSPLFSICRSSLYFTLNRLSPVYVFAAIVSYLMLWLDYPVKHTTYRHRCEGSGATICTH